MAKKKGSLTREEYNKMCRQRAVLFAEKRPNIKITKERITNLKIILYKEEYVEVNVIIGQL